MQTSNSSLPSPPSDNLLLSDKRAYLTLLPPPQLIEICLTFEAYAPSHVKSLIWPNDLNNAIVTLQAQQALAPASNDKLKVAPSEQLSDATSKPPDDSVSTSSGTAVPPTVTSATPQPYPHQPYGYAQSSYPHAPYHHPPFSYPSYPPPGIYPMNPHFPPAASHTPDSCQTTDDLPSYEEMIVEALTYFNDPEGSQPKNLFTWMASHYPLQTNFRPSASQALQKAYKRGRLEKSSGGRYRLSASWEGGNTSRRTTRRPQTLSQTTLLPQTLPQGPPHHNASPFTFTPLYRQSPSGSTASPAPNQPPYATGTGYPYTYGHPGYPNPPFPPPPLATTGHKEGDEGGDAWEAAQSILKAINFGDSIKSPKGVGARGGLPDAVVVTGSAERSNVLVEGRAELQAELALLAVQLAQVSGSDGVDMVPESDILNS